MTRLSPGTLILGIFAVLFGLVGALAAKRYLQQEPPPAEVAEAPRAQIVPTSGTDLVAGRTITLGDVALIQATPQQMKKMDLPPQFMTNPSQIIGRTLREDVPKGHAFALGDFYPEGLGPNVAERLRPGYRAITIELDEQATELAMIAAGSMVDVVFRTAPNELGYVPETTVTLLEQVEVLAIDEETYEGARVSRNGRSARGGASVTLAVTPEQAAALTVVEGHGNMSLVLRGKDDDLLAAADAPPQTLRTLLDLPEPEVPFTTQVYRRGQLTTAVFQDGQPTMVADSFNGLPVAAHTRGPTIASVSQRVAQKTATKDGDKGCGCGSDK
jgi:pilus assembly protein CpaB